jgi:hypothetical protein
LNDLAEVKKVSLTDLHHFLQLDHTSFTVLSVSTKHIESTDRISVTLSKNSARSFYLGSKGKNSTPQPTISVQPKDDCLKDAQNCVYFQFFNSKEKKLYTRFKDKVESNFEGKQANQPLLFLTLTFNTTHDNYQAFTTNWNSSDECWKPIEQKNLWLKDWAQNFDTQAEPLKIIIQKVKNKVKQHDQANYYLALFLRRVRRLWKPKQWKWTVVSELQKNGIWHFHLLSTPIVPYSHKCTLDKNFTSCWNCRAYISELWPYGRVESRSPGYKTISNYLAKYLSKSFHLRNLYAQHGLKNNHKTYRFFKNLYDYEQKTAILLPNGKKLDAETNQPLPKNQKIFRKFDYETQITTYFYRTNEQLVGKCSQPTLIKKNYRLGTRSLNSLSLLNLATKHAKKELYQFKKPKKPAIQSDFQEFLITRLLFSCKKAEFLQIPLEQDKVPKEANNCDQSILNHFQTNPVLHFSFLPVQAPLIRTFMDKLDDYAKEYDMEESKDFKAYPITHNHQHETTLRLEGLCGCEIRARNQYLDNWYLDYSANNSDLWRRTLM